MKRHKLLLGIEHLMTGVQVNNDGYDLEFHRESPSIVRIESHGPITAYWPINGATINSEEFDAKPARYGGGEAEWYALVVGKSMAEADDKSYSMQTYTRRADWMIDGKPSRYAPGEPQRFPEAVVTAMRRKHGAKADEFLAQLRWAGDHWFYNHERMYIGVEPDGYIHT